MLGTPPANIPSTSLSPPLSAPPVAPLSGLAQETKEERGNHENVEAIHGNGNQGNAIAAGIMHQDKVSEQPAPVHPGMSSLHVLTIAKLNLISFI